MKNYKIFCKAGAASHIKEVIQPSPVSVLCKSFCFTGVLGFYLVY